MHTDQITYLIEVSNTGSINSAAQNLFITPSALSMSLQKLEKELGLELLTRTQKGVVLTASGKRLVEISLNYFQEINKLIKAENSDYNISGALTLSVIYGVLDQMLSPFICTFYQTFPLIQLTYVESSIDGVCLSLAEEASDLALIVNCAEMNAPFFAKHQLEFHSLSPCHLVICTSSTHPLASYRTVTLHNLTKYPLIVFNPPACTVENNPLYKMLRYYGFSANQIILESNQTLISEMVHNNIGVSLSHITPHALVHPFSEHITQIPLKDDISLSFGYLLKQDTTLSLAASLFLNEFISYISHKTMHTPNFYMK